MNSNKERLLKILLTPYVSEKATNIGVDRQYVFKVIKDATKPEIKKAVELMFADKKINVIAVQVSNVKSKQKTFARIKGKRKGWKKAYVTLAEEQSIDFGTA